MEKKGKRVVLVYPLKLKDWVNPPPVGTFGTVKSVAYEKYLYVEWENVGEKYSVAGCVLPAYLRLAEETAPIL
jgi:hypothetical protein